MRHSPAARWFLTAMLTFQLGIGWQWPVAHASVASPQGQSNGVAPEHCLGHADLTPKTGQPSHAHTGSRSRAPSHHSHDCCGSLRCHCHGAPSVLAPELPHARAARLVVPLRPGIVASPPVARPTEPFRPPIAWVFGADQGDL